MTASSSATPPSCDGAAVFLDFDGTLVEIAPAPTSIAVPPGLELLLRRLMKAVGGAAAIITGRPIADIDRLVGALDLPVAGVHGSQVRLSSRARVQSNAPPVPTEAVKALVAVATPFEGAWVEEKGAAVAVHYRAAAPAVVADLERRLNEVLRPYADRMIMSPGRKVFEVVPAAMSKGAALETLMREPAFRGRRPIMIGDDRSDEPAMAMAERLGGVGLRVAGEHFPADGAAFRDPSEVRAWLNEFIEGAER